jgi:AraC-like DNA-binding protein
MDYLIDKKVSRLATGISENFPVRCLLNEHLSRSDSGFDMHYALEIGILMEGVMSRYYRQCEVTCRPGDVWLCGPWEPHGYKVTSIPCRALVLVVWPGFLSKASGECDLLAPFREIPSKRPLVSDTKKAEVLNIAMKLSEVIGRPGKYTDLWLVNKTIELLLILLENWSAGYVSAPRPDNEDYNLIMGVLEMAFRKSNYITVEEIASSAGMNRNLFSRKFREVMGIGFPDFMLRHRLNGAASDLAATGLSIDEIALKWGFTDKSHLHHRFRELYSFAPGEYRRLHHAK